MNALKKFADPGAAYIAWRRRRLELKYRGVQHHDGEAIGTILNGTRKPRWKTSRAATFMVFTLLGCFALAAAVGARNLFIGILAVSLLTVAFLLAWAEFSRRRRAARAPIL